MVLTHYHRQTVLVDLFEGIIMSQELILNGTIVPIIASQTSFLVFSF